MAVIHQFLGFSVAVSNQVNSRALLPVMSFVVIFGPFSFKSKMGTYGAIFGLLLNLGLSMIEQKIVILSLGTRLDNYKYE